ncbi:branched-chain amino acid transport system ATP-binding protein [Anaerotaenia torta]|uniref:ABC transporter ATP-binding protein n=1 Tax=Anaerotaenia torta TaxID=433293 RepID=UPI003D1CDB0E
MALLSVRDLNVYYGVIHAIKGISFHVNEGEVIALIGANGAGKTTILHTITGLVPAKSGSMEFDGGDGSHDAKSGKAQGGGSSSGIVELGKLPAHRIVSMGMAHVPEGRRIFQELTVLENLKLGAYTRRDKEEIDETVEKVYRRFPRLKERKSQIAGTLSGGEQQMLAMGRALMSHPRIILMDEPSMGLSPILVEEIFDIIKEISQSGTTVLLVEQNAKKALSIANRAYVLETGSIVLEGDASKLMNDESVKKAYLGE